MHVSNIAVSCECEIIAKNDNTQFWFDNDKYVVPFLFNITSKDGMLFDKISNYFISESWENGKLIVTDVRFDLYYIELYKNDFKKAIDDFKQIISLSCNDELKKDVLVKAFFNILDISFKSYVKACSYLKDVRKVRPEGVKELGSESFYKVKANDFFKVADRLDMELNANNFIGDDNFYFGFRRAASQAKDWYREVKFNASQNNVDIGTRKNFKEVLKEPIDNARNINDYDYVYYLESILNFLEFYYKWF